VIKVLANETEIEPDIVLYYGGYSSMFECFCIMHCGLVPE